MIMSTADVYPGSDDRLRAAVLGALGVRDLTGAEVSGLAGHAAADVATELRRLESDGCVVRRRGGKVVTWNRTVIGCVRLHQLLKAGVR